MFGEGGFAIEACVRDLSLPEVQCWVLGILFSGSGGRLPRSDLGRK